MNLAIGFACVDRLDVHQRNWILQESLNLMEQKTPGDPENLWAKVAGEMELAAASRLQSKIV